jgi:AraC family ethanolamine operon transcriptional activator
MLRRLWLARRALLRAGPEDLVKSIALDYGFWHLGRFSRIYHREFGELPSETLGRCRSAR